MTAQPRRPESTAPVTVPGWSSVADVLFLLSIDTRSDGRDAPDPLTMVMRWAWFELHDRKIRRAEARALLQRAMLADPPRLDLS